MRTQKLLSASLLLFVELHAAALEANATWALTALPEFKRAVVAPTASANECTSTLGDIEAMSHLGLYYAAKIRGACDLALFGKAADAKQQAFAVHYLELALEHGTHYAAAYTRQYVQPVLCNRAGVVDIPKQTEDVAADIQMARDRKTRSLKESNIKRASTEAGFKKQGRFCSVTTKPNKR